MAKIIGPPGVKCAYSRHIVPSPLILGQALARDGYRCTLTGVFYRTSIPQNRELKRLCDDIPSTTVQACHILNESTAQGIDFTGSGEITAVNEVCADVVSQVIRCAR